MQRMELKGVINDPTSYLRDDDPAVRRLAVSACAAHVADDGVVGALAATLDTDEDPRVRAEAAEVLALAGQGVQDDLLRHADTDDAIVAEAVATGLGEIESRAALPWLLRAAAVNDDRQVQEAAVAALGAIGDDRAVSVLLTLVESGPPQIRRRAVVALTAFDGDEVTAAIERATHDRNPMVREVAEMLVGRTIDGTDVP